MKTFLFSLGLLVTGLMVTGFVFAGETSTGKDTEQPASRIIALSPHAVEMLYAIGAGEQIVAAIERSDYPAAANDIPRIGNYTGIVIEQVIALKPDLIVTWNSGNKINQIEQLEAMGYPLYNSDPKTLDDIAIDLLHLGELTGREQQAGEVVNRFRQELSQLRSSYQDQRPVDVFYQLWSAPMMTIANGSWIQQLIEGCGGRNVFADAATAYPQISLENVLLKQPEVILIPGDHNQPTQSFDWQQWPQIPAVKQQHIYYLDGDLLHRATPRALLGMADLCQQLDKVRH